MEWSQYSIKILGDNFRNSILDNPNWDKISEEIIKKKHIWNRVNLLSKLWYIGKTYQNGN